MNKRPRSRLVQMKSRSLMRYGVLRTIRHWKMYNSENALRQIPPCYLGVELMPQPAEASEPAGCHLGWPNPAGCYSCWKPLQQRHPAMMLTSPWPREEVLCRRGTRSAISALLTLVCGVLSGGRQVGCNTVLKLWACKLHKPAMIGVPDMVCSLNNYRMHSWKGNYTMRYYMGALSCTPSLPLLKRIMLRPQSQHKFRAGKISSKYGCEQKNYMVPMVFCQSLCHICFPGFK